MARFTDQNTEGYSASALTELNTAFERVCELGDLPTDHPSDFGMGSLADHIAETLLFSYDRGLRGKALITAGCQG